MSEHVFLTGATGALGQPLAERLLARPRLSCLTVLVRDSRQVGSLARLASGSKKLRILVGDVTKPGLGAGAFASDPPVTAVIHSAAHTKFRAPEGLWNEVNVEGVRQVLAWREACCPDARFVQLSTLCAAGKLTGRITECGLSEPPGFVNGYESSKWQAEQLVGAAPGVVAIVRLATVIGNLAEGRLQRVGAFHHVLRWIFRGLLPLVPGDEGTRVDLIPTDFVTSGIDALLDAPMDRGVSFFHFSGGRNAVLLQTLIAVCERFFSDHSEAWRRGQIMAPALASREAFDEFRAGVLSSRDLLFTQVLESVDSFLPELFYPKEFSTEETEKLIPKQWPLGNWDEWMDRVLTFSLRTDFGRNL